MPAKISTAIRQRAARIKLFLCDVDGMLTNGPNMIPLSQMQDFAADLAKIFSTAK